MTSNIIVYLKIQTFHIYQYTCSTKETLLQGSEMFASELLKTLKKYFLGTSREQ